MQVAKPQVSLDHNYGHKAVNIKLSRSFHSFATHQKHSEVCSSGYSQEPQLLKSYGQNTINHIISNTWSSS